MRNIKKITPPKKEQNKEQLIMKKNYTVKSRKWLIIWIYNSSSLYETKYSVYIDQTFKNI